MKDVQKWVKDLSKNRKIAGKYKAVSTLEEIVKIAKKDGYTFSEKDLLKADMELVVGGKNLKDSVNNDSS